MNGRTKSRTKTRIKQTQKEIAEQNGFLELQDKTGFSEECLRSQHEIFIKICPTGEMTKQTFLDLSRQAMGDQVGFLSDSLFRIFDTDNSGTMDFDEYMLALKATNLTAPSDKLRWIFDVFDNDGSGTISTNEIEFLILGLFKMSGHQVVEGDLEEACKDIMMNVDSDGDGEITRQEFIENGLKSPFVASLLT